MEDLYLLCDLFYLPFEHGNRGFKLLNEFNWLKANASVLLSHEKPVRKFSNADDTVSPKPEVAEWLQRAESFSKHCNSVHELLRKIANCANKEICHDLFSYVWDIAGTLTLLNAFVKWLSLGHFPPNVQTYTQGTYTCKHIHIWKERDVNLFICGVLDVNYLQGLARAGKRLSCRANKSLGYFVVVL